MSKTYTGDYLDHIAFPLGGIGAGMFCIEGTGAFSHLSIHNKPNVFWEPCVFSAICLKGEKNVARVLEGPVPDWKAFGGPKTGNGRSGATYGLPRMNRASFKSEFPFAEIELGSVDIPLKVKITAWSPFTPGDADNSSLPVAGLEYEFINDTSERVEAVYSFNSANFMDSRRGDAKVLAAPNGFILTELGAEERPWDRSWFCAQVDSPDAAVNCRWFRGWMFDALTMAWNDVEKGELISQPPYTSDGPSPGGSIFVPLNLEPGERKTVRLMLSWYVPETNITMGPVLDEQKQTCGCGEDDPRCKPRHKPWYAGRFGGIEEVSAYWTSNYDSLKSKTRIFTDAFFDTTLPTEIVEAVEANLTILKSSTVLRQTDGRLWGWEGCCDEYGCCDGSCTHVWNYAQAIPHLFPDLERSLRQTEFNESQDEHGHQRFRSSLPIRPTSHESHAAADGQLGGIVKVYRDWRISGDTQWLADLWPKVKQSLDYCIDLWDPAHEGIVREPHHNTYDIEFWGPDGMCTSFYLAALAAAIRMGRACGDDVSLYSDLLNKGREYMQTHLFNGEYFIQQVQWTGLRAGDPTEFKALVGFNYSPEATELLRKEGPKYQYGNGCLSDGVIGCWLAACAGVSEFIDSDMVTSHLASIHKYNLKHDLSAHVNPQRPGYALGDEGGLLLCSWPKGDKLSLPFIYSDEVWTGIEYQVAAHCMMKGLVEEGLDIVRTARERYDGKKRNPFNEYECGHWYARAMSSYSLLQGVTGIRYDAVDKTLYIHPRIKGDFRSFLCTATGFGTVGVRDGEPFVEVRNGEIVVERVEYVRSGNGRLED